MFDEVFILLKNKLNNFLNEYIASHGGSTTRQDYVAFMEGDRLDPPFFPVNKVTPILLNIEEEKVLRPDNRYEGRVQEGKRTEVMPPIRINMLVLFISKFTNYEQALKFLSLTVKCFQHFPVFNHENTPSLSPEIERLRMELITLPINQQNDVWNALRTSYHPSVLYKIDMLVFRDTLSMEDYHEVKEVIFKEPLHIEPEKQKTSINI